MANKYTKIRPDKKQLIDLYDSGMTQAEVAEEMGLTQKIVWRCLRDYGVKCRTAGPRNQKGEKNNNWKGDNVTYAAFHYRLKSLKGNPKKCEVCNTSDPNRTYDWANLTGKYNDPKDYKRMCRSCHWKYDKKFLNFKGATGGRKAVAVDESS
jgi:hypothetical protein